METGAREILAREPEKAKLMLRLKDDGREITSQGLKSARFRNGGSTVSGGVGDTDITSC
ncbi:hypothetical protein F441_17138 [Phytophthora nicotianae CJ01A1]|nr:hypothetical protein F443_09442 [Phytophthora nicotianae P1569]ETP06472.1 hypothetical protein F441_17138 [Phytophthora nicotianae CJ01A1]